MSDSAIIAVAVTVGIIVVVIVLKELIKKLKFGVSKDGFSAEIETHEPYSIKIGPIVTDDCNTPIPEPKGPLPAPRVRDNPPIPQPVITPSQITPNVESEVNSDDYLVKLVAKAQQLYEKDDVLRVTDNTIE